MISLVAATAGGLRIDYTNALKSAKLATQRFDAPAKLSFEGVEDSGIAIPEGATVRLTDDGRVVFVGYVFTASRDRYGATSYVAYDQLRYLKAKQSYTFVNLPLEDIIRQIAGDFGLTVGSLAQTGYVFPSLIKEDEECLSIIFDALAQTIYQTGKIWVFYDDCGKLTLVEAKDLMQTAIIGDGSMMTDYTYTRDIDKETYNRIKLVRPNKTTGRTDAYVHEDTETIRDWGLLQYYDKVDENLNEAQIDKLCAQYLQYYNRVSQTLKLESMGITGIRAGMMLPVLVRSVQVLSVNRILMAEKVTHSWDGQLHKMTVEVKNFDQLGGAA